uniref:Uncharacterized protein n=1 Tax=Mycena chlorophos TaxID=658473 RepID=A0ABQ0LQ18_MYCCL|nr:predicted protein [Mycena chlorophos]
MLSLPVYTTASPLPLLSLPGAACDEKPLRLFGAGAECAPTHEGQSLTSQREPFPIVAWPVRRGTSGMFAIFGQRRWRLFLDYIPTTPSGAVVAPAPVHDDDRGDDAPPHTSSPLPNKRMRSVYPDICVSSGVVSGCLSRWRIFGQCCREHQQLLDYIPTHNDPVHPGRERHPKTVLAWRCLNTFASRVFSPVKPNGRDDPASTHPPTAHAPPTFCRTQPMIVLSCCRPRRMADTHAGRGAHSLSPAHHRHPTSAVRPSTLPIPMRDSVPCASPSGTTCFGACTSSYTRSDLGPSRAHSRRIAGAFPPRENAAKMSVCMPNGRARHGSSHHSMKTDGACPPRSSPHFCVATTLDGDVGLPEQPMVSRETVAGSDDGLQCSTGTWTWPRLLQDHVAHSSFVKGGLVGSYSSFGSSFAPDHDDDVDIAFRRRRSLSCIARCTMKDAPLRVRVWPSSVQTNRHCGGQCDTFHEEPNTSASRIRRQSSIARLGDNLICIH